MFQHSHSHAEQAPATNGMVIRWARFYDPLVSLLTLGQRARLRRETVALAQIGPGERVLEVGCGTGDVALAASRLAGPTGAVHGIDPAPEMIAAARQKAARAGQPANFRIGVIEALDFPDASVDVVLSSLMMHHLPADLKRRGLAEIARVLRPGGRLLIVDMRRPTTYAGRALATLMLHGSAPESIENLPELLRAAGFTQLRSGALHLPMLGYLLGQRPE